MIKLLITFSLLIFITIPAAAQLCGQYTTTLIVVDENANPVTNATVTNSSQGEDEIGEREFARTDREPHKYSLRFSEGTVIKEKYKVTFTAPGFHTAEKDVTFRYCDDQNITITLNSIEKKTIVHGILYDVNGGIISGAEVIFTRRNGHTHSVKSNEDGEYTIHIKPGEIYKVRAFAPNFKSTYVPEYIAPNLGNGKMRLDIMLEVGRIENIEIIVRPASEVLTRKP